MTTDTSPAPGSADAPPPRRRVMRRVRVTRGYWKQGSVDYTDHDCGTDS
jgi:hypothetical protein